eukprot:73711_1
MSATLFYTIFLFQILIFELFGDIPPPTEYWFTQRLDHFNPQDRRTFQQRYLVYNGSWNKKNNGPIFFYAGNEASIDGFWNNTGFMFDIAPQFGALIVFMEHRYYGKSLPFGNASNTYTIPNLVWYSMQQAIEDYAIFITKFKQTIYNAPNASVVVFGGSYGGELATLLRIHHPEIFHIALASSAPIRESLCTANSTYFFQIVTNDYDNVDSQCPDIVRNGYSQLIEMGKNANNYEYITNTFKLCNPIKNESDINHLQYWSRTALLTLAQFDYPYATNFVAQLPAYPVNATCNILKEYKNNSLLALAKASGLYYNASSNFTLTCFNQFEEYIFCADQTGCSPGPSRIVEDYGDCMDAGSAFITNNITDMFPPTVWDLNNLTKYCNETYDLPPPDLEWKQIWFPQNIIGTAITNIIFSNGELDPFIGGGYTQNLTNKLPAIVIADAAHHLDLRSSNVNDPQSVVDARKLEVQYIKQWLNEIEINRKYNKIN